MVLASKLLASKFQYNVSRHDEQAAALVNYLRAAWGGQKPDVTAATVRALR